MIKTIVLVLGADGEKREILIHFDILSIEEAQRVVTANGLGDFKVLEFKRYEFYSEIK